jgi:hypothetical protein
LLVKPIRPNILSAILLLAPFLLGGCKNFGISLSELARQVTPTINALLEAGKKNDLAAGLKTFASGSQTESDLKTLFASRRDVFDAFTPLKAEDASYSSVAGGGFAASTQLEAKVPNVPGVSLRAVVVDQGDWKLQTFEFFKTP